MDINVIKQIILRQQEVVRDVKLLRRNFDFEESMNYVLVGIRRAGKSYLLYQYVQQLLLGGHRVDEILFINFEDERISDITKDELHLVIDAYREMFHHKPYVFLDEIQNVDGWEHFARRLADEKYHVMITGSNAKMLSREIASTLGGRYMLKEVLPFAFAEYLKYKGIEMTEHWEESPMRADVVRMSQEYLYGGGLAESFDLRNKQDWHQALYERILLADIVVRNKIRNDRSLRLLVRKLAESVMQPSSIKRLQGVIQSDGTKITRETINEYLDYLHASYLTFSIQNYTDSLSERNTIQKHYFYDNGILNLFILQPETKLLENIVALTLYKKYGDRLMYYNKNVELDFYVPSEGKIVQVSYSLADISTRQREIAAIQKCVSFLRPKTIQIVTMNEEMQVKNEEMQIEVVPLYKWLLEFRG